MNLTVACDVLGLEQPFSLQDLKQAYYKAALRYHPDRNQGADDATEKFKTVKDAHDFLTLYLEVECEEETSDESYMGLLGQFIQVMSGAGGSEVNDILRQIKSGCQRVSIKAFQNVEKQTALKIFRYVEEYSKMLGLTDESLSEIREIVKGKMENDELFILNPTLDNLFNKDIYKLERDTNIYYVPLWHDELQFDEDGNSIIVKCVPDLPDHIHIDSGNNLHVNVKINISELLRKGNIEIQLGSRTFEVPARELRISKLQAYLFRRKGIPVINTREIYSVEKLADIVVHLELLA